MDFDPVKKIVPFTVFFVIANPATFKLTRSLFGSWVAAADGLPTTAGLLLHALVFVIVAHFVWRLVWGKKKSSYGNFMQVSPPLVRGSVSGGPLQIPTPEDIDGADCQ